MNWRMKSQQSERSGDVVTVGIQSFARLWKLREKCLLGKIRDSEQLKSFGSVSEKKDLGNTPARCKSVLCFVRQAVVSDKQGKGRETKRCSQATA